MFNFLNINPILFENIFGTGISVYWYGLLITLGVLAGIIVATIDCKRKGYSTDLPLDLALITVIIAVICARLYYVIFDTSGYFAYGTFGERLVKIVAIWDGGLAIYGAVIGGALAIFIYSLINKRYTLLQLFDLAAAPVALGQAIGRWGNFFNQEAFGNAVNRVELQWFPYAVHLDDPKMQGFTPGWYQATFFYESIWCLALAAFLFWFFKKQKYTGQVVILYFTLYGLERALVELLRQDSLMIPGTSLRVSSVLSGVFFLVGVGLLIYFAKHPPKFRKRAKSAETLAEVNEAKKTEEESVEAEDETESFEDEIKKEKDTIEEETKNTQEDEEEK